MVNTRHIVDIYIFTTRRCKHTHNNQDNKSVHQSKRRPDKERVAYDAQTGVANRGNGRRLSPKTTRQSRLPQVDALTHQPTAATMCVRIFRQARVDIQHGHVGIL